jgi:hypothetical protein
MVGMNEWPAHLPPEVLQAVVGTAAGVHLGVQARQHVSQVLDAAQVRRQVLAGDASEQLVDGEGGEAAVGLVDEELGDGAGEGLECPPVGKILSHLNCLDFILLSPSSPWHICVSIDRQKNWKFSTS